MSWEHARSHLIDSQRSEISREAAHRRWQMNVAANLDKMDERVRSIVSARMDRCMSQEGAAREMGISSVTLSRIETGRGNPGEQFVVAALAWAVAPHERDGLALKRASQPKPRYQRPLPSDENVGRVRWVAPPEPPKPVFLFSDKCPVWWPSQTRISEAACAWTKETCSRCIDCPGILELSKR